MEQKETLSEEVKEFNPEAFAGLDDLVEKVGQVESDEKEEKPTNLLDENSEEVESSTVEDDDQEESDFDWSLEEEEEEQQAEEDKESDDDWDSEEVVDKKEDKASEEEQAPGLNWDNVAEELGLEGASKEDIINAIKSKNEPLQTNDTVSKYEGYLNLSDRELLAADMKGSGMDEYDADESLDRMEDSGVLKHEALKIRKQIKWLPKENFESGIKKTIKWYLKNNY